MMPANQITGKPPCTTSVDGSAEEDARLIMSKRIAAMSAGTHKEPSVMTMNTWIEKHQNEYMNHVKENTPSEYSGTIRRCTKPGFG